MHFNKPDKCKKCIQKVKDSPHGKCYFCGNTFEYMKMECGCAYIEGEVNYSCNGELFVSDRLARKYCLDLKKVRI